MVSWFITLPAPIADGEHPDNYDQKPENFYRFHKLSPFVNRPELSSYCRSFPITRSKSARLCMKPTVAL